MKPIIVVTGATGFVGQALCKELLKHGHAVRGVVRSLNALPKKPLAGLEYVAVGDIDGSTDWSKALDSGLRGDSEKIVCVIHCAARTHVMRQTEEDAMTAYRTVNVDGTTRLAEQSAAMGVRRLVFLSSIKVNGEVTDGLRCFTHDDEPHPEDPYGISKWEAEIVLQSFAAKTGMEVVIVRSPLVYGPGVKGNLARMLGWVHRGIPLPLGSVDNRRSLVGLDNLVDLLIRCAEHPHAIGQTFLVSDGEDLSTSELLRRIAKAIGRSPRLFPVPVSLLWFAGRSVGMQGEVDRILGSLQVDISHTRGLLDWFPPVSVEQGIQKMVESYMTPR